MNGSSDILSNLALHHNSQFRCRQPNVFSLIELLRFDSGVTVARSCNAIAFHIKMDGR